MQRGRWRREALRRFARECANHAWSGAGASGPVGAQNVDAVKRWLCQQKAFHGCTRLDTSRISWRREP
eukprot:7133117-Pyramimonas_sp.AAC.1